MMEGVGANFKDMLNCLGLYTCEGQVGHGQSCIY